MRRRAGKRELAGETGGAIRLFDSEVCDDGRTELTVQTSEGMTDSTPSGLALPGK